MFFCVQIFSRDAAKVFIMFLVLGSSVYHQRSVHEQQPQPLILKTFITLICGVCLHGEHVCMCACGS